jgi:hypothetical protein
MTTSAKESVRCQPHLPRCSSAAASRACSRTACVISCSRDAVMRTSGVETLSADTTCDQSMVIAAPMQTPPITYVRAYIVSRHRLWLEIAALRQQLVVCKRKRPRPLLRHLDRLFWVGLRQWWTGWASALIIVRAETVVSWHRAGFQLFWRLRSRPLGRPKISDEIRGLIRRMKRTTRAGERRASTENCCNSASTSRSRPSLAICSD